VAVRLYFVQHGQPTAESENPDRPLTDRGVEDVKRVARQAIEPLGTRPTRLLHSGKTRARQTAEIWGGLLGIDAEAADALAPNDDPTIWAERVGAQTDDLMLVGHLPHLARLTGLLLTGTTDRTPVKFRQGGLVALERTDTGWEVSAVLPPEAAL
jgi:phosphohistidine phosphatase